MHRGPDHRWETRSCQPGWKLTGFTCQNCQANVYASVDVSHVKNRNHCPNCLHSRHMDWREAGDRMSACKAIMIPIGISMKWSHNKYARMFDGELMLVHRCSECGKLSINRIAADDMEERLMEIFDSSQSLDDQLISQLRTSGIVLLAAKDKLLVTSRLLGNIHCLQ